MTINTVSRLGSVLAALVLVFAGISHATPAFAYYGALEGTQPLSAVCNGRYDPTCLMKETAYAQQLNAPYTSWHNYQYQAPALPHTYGVPYVAPTYVAPTYYNYTSYPYSYSYNYQYQYVMPATSYYAAPTYYTPTAYSYDDYNSYDSYDSYDNYESCGSYSYNCGY